MCVEKEREEEGGEGRGGESVRRKRKGQEAKKWCSVGNMQGSKKVAQRQHSLSLSERL